MKTVQLILIWTIFTGFHEPVLCSFEGNSSDQISTSTYTYTIAATQTTLSTQSGTGTGMEHLKNANVTYITTTNPALPYDGGSEDNIFMISTIAGASAGFAALLAIIIICTYVLLRRSRTVSRTKYKGNTDNEAEASGKPRLKNINKSYETDYEMTNITSKTPSGYTEEATNNVYSEPVDSVANDVNAELTKGVGNIQNSSTDQMKYLAHNYQEPYEKSLFIAVNENKYDYSKVIKVDTNVYNTLSDMDNYSHIHVLTNNRVPKAVDQYSHIRLGQREGDKITEGRSTDMYSQFKLENNQQNVPDSVEFQPMKEANSNTETEYDHLAYYLHN